MNHSDSPSGAPDPVRTDWSRRSLLAGALSMSVLPSAIAAGMRRGVREDAEVVDVLLVGAGVSGCYAACRLSQKSPGSRIELHERSDRIGGRLWSIKPEGMTRQVAELGGMRIANNQTPLLNLVSELGLTVDPYPATTPQDLYFLRGIRTRASKLVASPEFGYRVREDLRGKTLHELFRFVVKTATGQETWARDEMREAVASVRYRGRLLHDLPYEWVFNDILGHEGAAMLFAGMGYGRPNTNAAVFMKEAMLDLFVHGYSHVRGGYQQVPLKLADRARQQGVDIHFGHEMNDLRFEGDLTVVTFRTSDGETLIRKAKKVVTTLPMSAYQYLPDQCPLRGSNGLTAMESEMLPVPATKIYVNFPNQWWNGMGIKSGRSITDIPIRQVFYLDDPSGRGLSLSPYAAGVLDSGFWSPLLPSTGHRADGDCLAAVTIRKQLAEMHGIDIPKPSEILFRSFDGGKVGYGWNMWRPGVEPWKIAPAARQPIPGREVYCVGEATSTIQGWVMETIETTESVLRSKFGLGRPDWWPASYELQ
ncbi:MAG: NAD(P)/FAD-dependent oxidoreductase [Phycisphaerales bacterium]|nr:NAD(P)/FAD-dependent oxidoreductase [Phycisphaerales bacterium]